MPPCFGVPWMTCKRTGPPVRRSEAIASGAAFCGVGKVGKCLDGHQVDHRYQVSRCSPKSAKALNSQPDPPPFYDHCLRQQNDVGRPSPPVSPDRHRCLVRSPILRNGHCP